MLDITNGSEIRALYKMVYMKNSERIVEFKTTDINSALGFLQWYVRRYRHSLLLEISTIKKIYDWKTKSVQYVFS